MDFNKNTGWKVLGALLCATVWTNGYGQRPAEWTAQKETARKYAVHQLALLEEGGRLLRAGYELAREGLDHIEAHSAKEKDLHTRQFQRRGTPAAGILGWERTLEEDKRADRREQRKRAFRAWVVQSKNLTAQERQYARQWMVRWEAAVARSTAMHHRLLASGDWHLSDKGRWSALQAAATTLQALDVALERCFTAVRGIAHARSRDLRQLAHLRTLYR